MITIKKLSKSYQMGEIKVEALREVSLHIEKGEYLSIMGPSGSGKSTLMNILGCLDTPTKGDYILDGQDISHLSEKELALSRRYKIGFVFQSFNLLSQLTLLENVSLAMSYAGVEKKTRILRAKALLEKVGLIDRIYHRPSEISGGQKQRVAIARALANNPTIILADEPTGNLDSKSENEIMKIFEQLSKEGKTIIIVTHEISVARRTNRVIKFMDGEVISDEKQQRECLIREGEKEEESNESKRGTRV